MAKREWKEEEYMVALYLYRFGFEEIGIRYSEIARTPDSLIMRFANFLNCENENAGLKGGRNKVRKFNLKYKDIPKDLLKGMVLEYIGELE